MLFLKLGGSLITDKRSPRTPRLEVLARLMREIAEARALQPALKIVLGHGSGSFGHVEAQKHNTRAGVHTPEEWRGFAEVQYAANLLNRWVVDAAHEASLPIFNCPPSASAVARDTVVEALALAPIENALVHGLIPLVQGDVALDVARGGTIVSTEDVFKFLAPRLQPTRILLAGIERGVLTHWPDGAVIAEIRADHEWAIGDSHAADVTGGMAAKVRETLALMAEVPACEALIFSGAEPGLVRAALLGEAVPGTLLR